MAETFKFELVSPERIEISDDAEQVVVPGAEGDFAVLPGHELRVSTLRPGVIDATFALIPGAALGRQKKCKPRKITARNDLPPRAAPGIRANGRNIQIRTCQPRTHRNFR